MDFKILKNYLLKKTCAKEDFPFGPSVLVFKVLNKMFAFIAWDEDPLRISLKCDPEHAQALRAIYPSVKPSSHFKDHWNTVTLDGSIRNDMIFEMIDDSYNLVVQKLNKEDRQKLIPD